MKIIPLLLVLPLVGCMSILRVNSEDPQMNVDKRVVGMQVGDFFERYGAPRVREEAPDGTLQFNWEGGRNKMAAGPRGLREPVPPA